MVAGQQFKLYMSIMVKFFNYNINFSFLKKKQILYLKCRDIQNYVASKEKNCIFINSNEINFFILLKAFILTIVFRQGFKNAYLTILIRQLSPKIIVQNDLTLTNYNFKENFPDILYVIYQFGFIRNNIKYKKFSKKIKCDYFLTISNKESKIQKKYFNANFIIFGFLRSVLVKKNKKIFFFINFISEYDKKKNKKEIKHEKILLQIISKICKINNVKMHITLRSNRFDKNINRNEEINFY